MKWFSYWMAENFLYRTTPAAAYTCISYSKELGRLENYIGKLTKPIRLAVNEVLGILPNLGSIDSNFNAFCKPLEKTIL